MAVLSWPSPKTRGASRDARQATSSPSVLNDATRHLCLGAYVDHDYCTSLLRHIYFDRARRLAPSYAYELPAVLVHARRAWLLDIGQHGIVASTVLVSLLIDPFSLAVAVTIFISWYVLRHAARLISAYSRFLLGLTHPEEPDRMRAKAMMFGLALAGTWGLMLLVLFLTKGATPLELVRQIPLRKRITAVVALMAGSALASAWCRQRMIENLRPGVDEPTYRSKRLKEIAEQQKRSVTVYSGFRPFVGSGLELVTWSFAQRLLRRIKNGEVDKEGEEVPFEDYEVPFTTEEMVNHLRDRIAALASDRLPERRLPDLTVKDHIFVTGTHANHVPEFPQYNDFLEVMTDTTKHTRHYLACQVPSWNGEVVTTVYVHISLQGRTLYLEFSTLALPPTREEFHVRNRVGGTGIRAYAKSIIKTTWNLPETLVRCQLSLITAASGIAYLVSTKRWSNLEARGVDVGAKLSARELGADLPTNHVVNFRRATDINYFQLRDVIKHAKVIERRLLAAVFDFLTEKDISTAEYSQRVTTILNSGILHVGEGDVNVTGVVGEQGTFYNGSAPGGMNGSPQ